MYLQLSYLSCIFFCLHATDPVSKGIQGSKILPLSLGAHYVPREAGNQCLRQRCNSRPPKHPQVNQQLHSAILNYIWRISLWGKGWVVTKVRLPRCWKEEEMDPSLENAELVFDPFDCMQMHLNAFNIFYTCYFLMYNTLLWDAYTFNTPWAKSKIIQRSYASEAKWRRRNRRMLRYFREPQTEMAILIEFFLFELRTGQDG